MRCPSCQADVHPEHSICEACGATAGPGVPDTILPVQPRGFEVIVPQGPQRRAALPYAVWPVLGVGVMVLLLLFVVTGLTIVAGRSEGSAPTPAAWPAATQPESDKTADAEQQVGIGQQAAAVDALLNESAASRAKLGTPLARLNACRSVPRAVPALRRVEAERSDQLSRAQLLDVDQLSGGEQLRQSLVEVLSLSLEADRAYESWADWLIRHGCGGARSDLRSWDSAASADTRSRAKKDFVSRWNPIARAFGLPTRGATEI